VIEPNVQLVNFYKVGIIASIETAQQAEVYAALVKISRGNILAILDLMAWKWLRLGTWQVFVVLIALMAIQYMLLVQIPLPALGNIHV